MTGDQGSVTQQTAPKPAWWRGIDSVLTVLLFAVLGFAAVALIQVGRLVAMQADVCGDGLYRCDDAAISAGAMIASYGPLVLLIAAIVVAVLRLHRQRAACFVPLIGIAATVGVLWLAGEVVSAAIVRGG